ncbi:uroporphyrinogen-III synthase [uncultured Aquimarina sp.]|uniref:uroporphyrinogen-III synthase n=1 Tax=uncultured Aquimarina sp. TaxID=575652 RepID=UPI0026059400|nr:uroporphyrinogen-III synthase [uncultured Aquimarina sp.]
MSSNYSILSTKKLSASQKELLLNSGIGFVEYNAIEIELLDVEFNRDVQYAIFTSKNAVRAIFNNNSKSLPLLWKRAGVMAFCVGENTKKLLEENGQKVMETTQNASELGEIIAKKYKNERFSFFCGNLRRDELPSILKENTIELEEIVVYKTHMKPKKFDRTFDGILFFSPSGVQSYISNNAMKGSMTFCIGNTTASEVKKHTKNNIVANKPTVENVIVQAVKYFDTRI